MRFRLYPSATQTVLLLEQCGHARYVWNLGLEQRLMWARWKGPTPGFNAQAGQLTAARAAEPWLACGSQTVQQQALRDLDQAWQRFFAGTHRRPTWRKAGEHEGLRIVGPQGLRVRRDNRARSSVLVPKVGWVSFKRSRDLVDWRSYRITRDRAGRWHIAFAVIPEPIAAPGTGEVVGVDRGVSVAVALSTGEMTSPAGLSPKEAERLLRVEPPQESEDPDRPVESQGRRPAQRLGGEDQHRPRHPFRRDPGRGPQHQRYDPHRAGNHREAGQERRTEGGPQSGHPQIRLGSARHPVGAEGSRSGREGQSCVHVADL